jgi:pimeloyl-ACP methyl ester carboxylesterase
VFVGPERPPLDALYSDPFLLCPEVDQFNVRVVGLAYDAASTGRVHVDATRSCYRRLKATGVDLGAYNTTENAADFADLRTALGISQWNVYGTSYGTDLALTYMRQHPQAVRSVVIDSVVPPEYATLSSTWRSAREAFDNLFRACSAQAACAARYPNLDATFTRLVGQLEARPITTTVTLPDTGQSVQVVLDGGAILQWLIGAGGFQPAIVPAAIDQLAHGDATPIATALGGAADPTRGGVSSFGLDRGVFCGEWVPYEPAAEVLKVGKRLFPQYPRSVLVQPPQLAWTTEDCAVWKVPKAPARQRAATTSRIPTLVISGSFDARTSPRQGQLAAKSLPNSTVVTLTGIGHIVVPKSPCAQRVMASFLATPSQPDVSCVAASTPPPFNT